MEVAYIQLSPGWTVVHGGGVHSSKCVISRLDYSRTIVSTQSAHGNLTLLMCDTESKVH